MLNPPEIVPRRCKSLLQQLVGGWPTPPEKYESQLGWYGKIKFMFQTTKQIKHVFWGCLERLFLKEQEHQHYGPTTEQRFSIGSTLEIVQHCDHRLTSQGSLPWHPKDPSFMTLCCWRAYVHMFNIAIIGEIGQTAKSYRIYLLEVSILSMF